MPDLVADDIEKQLGTAQVLCGVSFQLQQREILALLGPSGSGKIVFDAGSGFEIPAEQRGLGLVFQSYAIWPHRSVFENVAYGLRLRRARETDIQKRVGEVLER